MSKPTTDVVTYCTEASIKNQNMRTGKHCFTKKALAITQKIQT